MTEIDYHEKGDKLAERHVDFLLCILRPLMIAEFVHGYKHGLEDALEKHNQEFKMDAKPCTHPRGYIKSIRICGLCGEQI